jgi:hypothetical protein
MTFEEMEKCTDVHCMQGLLFCVALLQGRRTATRRFHLKVTAAAGWPLFHLLVTL